MSNTIIKPNQEDRKKINAEIKKKLNDPCRQFRFDNFQEIQIEGTFTIAELKAVTDIIEMAEAFLALESKPLEFKNNN